MIIMPGWNLELSIVREQSLFWYMIWKECDKPQAGQIVTIMRYIQSEVPNLFVSVLQNTIWRHSNSPPAFSRRNLKI